MHPSFELGLGPAYAIQAWLLFALLAFWFAIGWMSFSLGKWGVTPKEISLFLAPLPFAWFLGAFIGQELTVGHRNWSVLVDGKLNFGGMVLYGGMISTALAALLAWLWSSWRRKVSIETLFDLGMVAFGLLIVLGRLGCFFHGCCYGSPAGTWPGIVIPHAANPLFREVPLHPTPLYESLGTLVLTLIGLWTTQRHIQGRPWRAFRVPGITGWMIVGGYAALRFSLEFIRADDRGPLRGGLSSSQWIALAFLIALPFDIQRHRRIAARKGLLSR